MWIRSQNKRILSKVNEVLICTMDDNKYFIEGFWDRGSDTLGIYSSEEKALKVLDEIQTSIMTEHQFRIDELNCTRNYFGKEYKEIYQMPEDEDI